MRKSNPQLKNQIAPLKSLGVGENINILLQCHST